MPAPDNTGLFSRFIAWPRKIVSWLPWAASRTAARSRKQTSKAEPGSNVPANVARSKSDQTKQLPRSSVPEATLQSVEARNEESVCEEKNTANVRESQPEELRGKDSQNVPARGVSTDQLMNQHLLNLVDLLDMVAGMKSMIARDSSSLKPLEVVESRLSDMITLSGGEVIRDADWNPARQRAVRVMVEETSAPKILSSQRLGLLVGGRIVRKQEVFLIKPSHSP
jgi:hypothetical protein